MAIDIESIDKWFDSPEGKASIEKFKAKMDHQERRIQRAHQLIQEGGETFIHMLIQNQIAIYTDEYEDKCYKRGYMPYPTNITSLLFDVAEQYGKPFVQILDEFDEHFGASTVTYMGYQWNWIHGQGTVLRIFKDGVELLRI